MATDPRSVPTVRSLGDALLGFRRYSEAKAVFDRGLSIAPKNMGLWRSKIAAYLAEGDVAGARAVLNSVPADIDPTVVAQYMGMFGGLSWVLDEPQQQLLLRLTPAAFDNDRVAWGLALALTYSHRGDSARARAYADSVRIVFRDGLKAMPNDAYGHVLYGLALAHVGREVEAMREGELAARIIPVTEDAVEGAAILDVLAQIYILAGERDRAVRILEQLLAMPGNLTPGWLRTDPTYAPLRGNPRFERLVSGQ
jgi:tetratricopeptide (TPR) repeat protein